MWGKFYGFMMKHLLKLHYFRNYKLPHSACHSETPRLLLLGCESMVLERLAHHDNKERYKGVSGQDPGRPDTVKRI